MVLIGLDTILLSDHEGVSLAVPASARAVVEYPLLYLVCAFRR